MKIDGPLLKTLHGATAVIHSDALDCQLMTLSVHDAMRLNDPCRS